MNKSETIGEFAAALSAAQSVIKPAIKSSDNPFFKSKYADLSAVWDVIREPLAKNGLAVIQTTDTTENGVVVETILAHKSGEWVSGSLRMPVNKSDAQAVGSAITYARRYALAAMVGVVADVDDDANAASQSSQNAKTSKAPTQTAKTAQSAPNAQTDAIRGLVADIKQTVSELNKLGDSIAWTPKRLDEFTQEITEKQFTQCGQPDLDLVKTHLLERLRVLQLTDSDKEAWLAEERDAAPDEAHLEVEL